MGSGCGVPWCTVAIRNHEFRRPSRRASLGTVARQSVAQRPMLCRLDSRAVLDNVLTSSEGSLRRMSIMRRQVTQVALPRVTLKSTLNTVSRTKAAPASASAATAADGGVPADTFLLYLSEQTFLGVQASRK